MTDLKCKDLVPAIKADFGSLWHCEPRGKSLEIVTPYLYPDNSFISVFVTTRGKRIIVSDGGQLCEFVEGAKDDEAFLSAILARSAAHHGISEVTQAKRKFHFKAVDKLKLVSSAVFDLCNFLVATSSAATLSLTEDETMDRNSFRAKADKFIRIQIPKNKGLTVSFNKRLEEAKEATFSAVIARASSVSLVIYLTGCNLRYFQLSVSQAIINVQMARSSSLNKHINSIIPVLNDEAVGYLPNKLTERLAILKEATASSIIPWKRGQSDLIQALEAA